MGKGTFYRVLPTPDDAGVRRLAPLGERVEIRPGTWKATLSAVGLADEVIAGSSDKLLARLFTGDKPPGAPTAGAETSEIEAKFKPVRAGFELKAGAEQPVSTTLVLDRGTAPDLLEEFRVQLLAELPSGATPAIVAAALAGTFKDLAMAAVVAAFVAAGDALLEATFGDVAVLNEKLGVVGVDDGDEALTVCLTELPDPRGINVGVQPEPEDFGIGADGRLVATRRGRSVLPASDHEGWVPAQRNWATVELVRG